MQKPYSQGISLAMAFFFISSSALFAQVVSSANDAGPGSLRAVIQSATNGATISFANSLGAYNINLASALVLDKDLTIDATNSSVTLTGASGVLTVNGTSLNLLNVDVSDATATSGAAVLNNGGRVFISESKFENNTATGAAATTGGGAIASVGGFVKIERSEFRNNRASGASGSGGAILTLQGAQLEVDRTLFIFNTASRAGGAVEDASGATSSFYDVTFDANTTGSAPGNGGALHVSGPSNVTIEACSATANVATREGGAFWNGSGTMKVGNTLLDSNIAQGDAANQGGGGIFNLAGRVVLTGNTALRANQATGASGSGGAILNNDNASLEAYGIEITGNFARRAGGGIEDRSGASTTMLIANVLFANNRTGDAPGNGGALHITGNGNVEFHGGIARNNTASSEGGALWNGTGRMLVLNMEISDNTASGNDADTGGGGIFNDGGSLEIQNNTRITNNIANGTSGSGGGILNVAGGNLKVVKSTITGNSASRAGGGIEDASGSATTIEMFQVVLSNNTTGSAPGNGGGLHITGPGNADIYSCTVENNTAASEGGGLWNGSGRMYLDRGIINNNTASGDDATNGGGGIFNNGGELVIVNGPTISNNVADGTSGSGGGIFNADGGKMAIYAASINNNTANRAGGGIEDASGASTTIEFYNLNLVDNVVNTSPGNGGGLHITGDGNMIMKVSNVTRNSAGSEGGGLWNNAGTMTLNDVSVSENIALGNNADNGGGGIYNNGGTLILQDKVRVNDNVASGTSGSGGGILNTGTAEINGSFFTNNSAQRAGGAIEDASNASLTVRKSFFNGNDAGMSPGNGGGIHISGSARVEITETTFENNTSVEGGGFWHGSGLAIVNNSSFFNNSASGDDATNGGGGIFVKGGIITLSNSQLSQNQSTGNSGSGGGLFLDSGSAATISNVSMSENTASRAGGGIEDNSGSDNLVVIENSSFTNNVTGSAPGNGGGIHITGPGDMNVLRSEFIGNTASNEGGALWNGAGTMNVEETTVLENSAPFGGGLFNKAGILNVSRSTVSTNAASSSVAGAPVAGGGIYTNTASTTNIEFSTITANTSSGNAGGIANAGETNITASTVAANQSDNRGGGIGQTMTATQVSIGSSIVAANTSPAGGTDLDLMAGAYVSNGFNLIGNDNGNLFPSVATDQAGSPGNAINPLVGPLQDNGGPTPTHALLQGSPAIGAGNPAILVADQRGEGVVAQRDAGAFESNFTNFSGPQSPTVARTSELEVFPTISQGESVTIRTSNTNLEASRFLLDANGKLVRELTNNQSELSLDGLMPGIYYVQEITSNGVNTAQITIVQ